MMFIILSDSLEIPLFPHTFSSLVITKWPLYIASWILCASAVQRSLKGYIKVSVWKVNVLKMTGRLDYSCDAFVLVCHWFIQGLTGWVLSLMTPYKMLLVNFKFNRKKRSVEWVSFDSNSWVFYKSSVCMLCVSFRSIIDHRFLTHFLFYVCLVECKYYILTNVCSQGRQHQ